jgi:hypothetical protein
MTRLCSAVLLVGVLVFLPGLAVAQQPAPDRLAPTTGLASNQVQVLAPAGDSLWSGPLLTLYLEPADRPSPEDSLLAAQAPALTEEDNVVFALNARTEPDAPAQVWAGLAFSAGQNTAAAGGFLVSTDGGETFARRADHLDAPEDTTVTYGPATLPATAVVQEANSAPQDLAVGPDGDTAWVAGNQSGLRRSVDQGRSWSRVVLPPDTLRSITPDSSYSFRVGPPQSEGAGWRNHVVFSTLVDETGTLWAGTGAGLNRSRPQDVGPQGERAWQRFAAGPQPERLTGNTVVAVAEQPRVDARNPIWLATWAGSGGAGGQRFGVTMTPNGGDTFRKVLVGERIFDLAAREARVFAVGEQGLFVSENQGQTWRSINEFRLRGDTKTLPPEVTTRSVAVTSAALWVGTTDGLLRLDRSQEARLLSGASDPPAPRWTLLRAQVPVNPSPDQTSEQVPDVEAYAYPNPFVPSRDQLVRIAYELDSAGPVTVTVYDFGMNKVWSATENQPRGQQETTWDGTDDRGLRVPTGTYFYTVETGGQTVRGKILLTN